MRLIDQEMRGNLMRLNGISKETSIYKAIKIRTPSEVQSADKAIFDKINAYFLDNQSFLENNPRSVYELMANGKMTDFEWLSMLGKRSGLRWLMGMNWDEGIDLTVIEQFFEKPEKYVRDERIETFLQDFLLSRKEESPMKLRTQDEVWSELLTFFDKFWSNYYLRAATRKARGIVTFKPEFWEKVLQYKQQLIDKYGKDALNTLYIKNETDYAITLGKFYALRWYFGLDWDFNDDMKYWSLDWQPHEIPLHKNTVIGLVECETVADDLWSWIM